MLVAPCIRLARSSTSYAIRCRALCQSVDDSVKSIVHTHADKYRIKPTKTEKSHWIDSLRIYCKGGHGGNGFKSRGGVGGVGGEVIFETQAAFDRKVAMSKKKRKAGIGGKVTNLNSLYFKHFKDKKQRLEAGNGGDAEHDELVGRRGAPLVLPVPPGVAIKDDVGNTLCELNEPNIKLVVARGGQGGGPKTNWLGLPGECKHLRLEYKLLADIGLIGFPNAGKSTLLKAISRARPKISSYPFTTLRPNIGHIGYRDDRIITMADLPGLIEGASFNVGMGHKFLKHVERTKLLLFVIDIEGFQLNPNSAKRSAFETLALLNRELELYQPELLDKPASCVVNKMDLDGSAKLFDELKARITGSDSDWEDGLANVEENARPRRRIHFHDIMPVSAKFSQKSVATVKLRLRSAIDTFDGRPLSLGEIAELEKQLDSNMYDIGPKLM